MKKLFLLILFFVAGLQMAQAQIPDGSTDWGNWLACASMAVVDWLRMFWRENSVLSRATSTSLMAEVAAEKVSTVASRLSAAMFQA